MSKPRAWNSTLPAPEKPLDRSGPLPKRNAKRQSKRRAEDRVYGSYWRWVKTLPCAVGGEGDPCEGPVTGHHIRSVGAGGEDAGNCSPLCARHHRLIHDIGPKRFDARFFNDIKLHAELLWRRYRDDFDKESA